MFYLGSWSFGIVVLPFSTKRGITLTSKLHTLKHSHFIEAAHSKNTVTISI